MNQALMEIEQEQNTLDSLFTQFKTFKREEDAAKAKRLKVEEEILSLVESKTEGSVTIKTDIYKVSIGYKVTRKLDSDKLQENWNLLPNTVKAAVRWKPELDAKNYKALEDDAVAALNEYITSTPAKPSFKVEIN